MSQSSIGKAVRYGLIAGLVAVSVSAIGMVETFNERDIITGVLTLGQVLALQHGNYRRLSWLSERKTMNS